MRTPQVAIRLLGTLLWLLATPSAAADPALVLTQAPVGQAGAGGAHRGGLLGATPGEGARLALLEAGGSLRLLSRGFHSAADPTLSFDGERVLFAGKRRADDPWNIHEMVLRTGEARQITQGLGDCRSPAYQSALYTIDSPEPWYQLTFVSTAAGEWNEAGGDPATSLYSCRLDGSQVRRLTFNPSSDLDPFLMPDGRILHAAWQRADLRRGPLGRIGLFGINLDGTDLEVFSADEGRRFKRSPVGTSGGLVVFVESDELTPDGAGQLASVAVRRNLHSYRALTDDPDHLFLHPAPLPDGTVLVSRRPRSGGSAGIVRFDPATGSATPVFDDPDRDDLQARPVVSTPLPDGRSSVVNETDPNGRLYCLDARISDLGPGWVPPGTLRRVRVLEGLPRRGPARTEGPGGPALIPQRLLGEVDLEADGSFNLEVPANVPIRLQVVDADGLAVRSCGWIWVRNHEPRGCIGCHEDGERTPPNRFVDAMRGPSIRLTPPPAERRTVDFRADVMPVITRRCATAGCHGAGDVAPDLSSDGTAYDALVHGSAGEPRARSEGHVDPGRSRTSGLMAHLFGRSMARPWDDAPPFPVTGPPVEMPADERRVLLEWIDLGAPWGGAGDGHGAGR